MIERHKKVPPQQPHDTGMRKLLKMDLYCLIRFRFLLLCSVSKQSAEKSKHSQLQNILETLPCPERRPLRAGRVLGGGTLPTTGPKPALFLGKGFEPCKLTGCGHHHSEPALPSSSSSSFVGGGGGARPACWARDSTIL